MDAIRRGDRVEIRCDLPGIDVGSVRVDVVDRVLTVRAERRAPEREGDEPLELECAEGAVARDVLLGEDLDPLHLEHDYRDRRPRGADPGAEPPRGRRHRGLTRTHPGARPRSWATDETPPLRRPRRPPAWSVRHHTHGRVW